MTTPTENPIPSQQDDIKSVLQDTLFQQVQTLLNFTRTDTLQLQIPNTDTHIFAGPRTRIAEFIQREIATPAANFGEQPLWDENGEPWNEAAEQADCVRLGLGPRVEQPTGDLPKLPLGFYRAQTEDGVVYFDAEDMRAYARAALASQSQAAQPTDDFASELDMPEFWRLVRKYGSASGIEERNSAANALLAHVAHIAGTSQATKQPSEPTDISQRLREYADNPGYSHNDYADTMRAATEEIERYYGGMLAWKQTAEKKDRDWNAERMGRVNDRIAAGTSQATKAQAEPIYQVYTYVGNGGWVDTAKDHYDNTPEDVRRIVYASPIAKEAPAVPEVVRRAIDVLEMLEGKPTGNDARVRKLHSAVEAYEASVAKEATRDAETTEKAKPIAAAARAAERVEAMHKGVVGVFAAIKAEHLAQANVLPPTRGTDSQHNADPYDVIEFALDLAENKGNQGAMDFLSAWWWETNDDFLRVHWPDFAKLELASRGRAQGGNTSNESGSDIATTTSTVSAPPSGKQIFEIAAPYFAWNAESWHRATQGTVGMPQLLEYTRTAIEKFAAPSSAEGAQKAPEEVRESATDKAIQRAAGELPDGYEVVIELENGAGGVVWIDEHGERHIIEGEGHISDDINEAIDRALEHAAPDALRTSSTDQANADTGSAA